MEEEDDEEGQFRPLLRLNAYPCIGRWTPWFVLLLSINHLSVSVNLFRVIRTNLLQFTSNLHLICILSFLNKSAKDHVNLFKQCLFWSLKRRFMSLTAQVS